MLLSGDPGGDSEAFSKVLYNAPKATTACRIDASECLSCSTLRVQNSESKNPDNSLAVCVLKTWKYSPSCASNAKAPGAYVVGENRTSGLVGGVSLVCTTGGFDLRTIILETGGDVEKDADVNGGDVEEDAIDCGPGRGAIGTATSTVLL